MKVLLVHNRYQERGGEDVVFEAERALLERAGVTVETHETTNHRIDSLASRIGAFTRVTKNRPAIAPLLARVRNSRFEVVHVHNFFPLLSPYLHQALADCGLPVVQTLHNFRLLCANGLFLREDRVCELCLGSKRHALVHRCYRGSLAGTLAVLRAQRASIGDPRWIASVARFIALTGFARDRFASSGLPADRIVVKPNSTPDPGDGLPAADRCGALFVGRLAPGKGVSVLLQAWQDLPQVPLTIIGDGPDMSEARALAPPNVAFAGMQSREVVLAHMKRAAFLILPSTCYEGLPLALVEALACGLPVIASRHGGLPELVSQGKTGFLSAPGDAQDLAATVRHAFGGAVDREAMGRAARASYEERFLPETNARQLLAIYREAMAWRDHRD